MGRPPIAAAPLTRAERQKRFRDKKEATLEQYRLALVRIQTVKTAREAREIATAALEKA